MKSVILSLALGVLFASFVVRSAAGDQLWTSPHPAPFAGFAPDRLPPGAAERMAPEHPFATQAPQGPQSGFGLGGNTFHRRPAADNSKVQ
jgi:hypothetical protein